MSLQMEYGKYGAKRTAFKSADPEAILLGLIKKNPTADIEELRKLFTEAVDARARRDELREVIDLYYVTNNARRLRHGIPRPRRQIAELQKEKEEITQRVVVAVERAKANFLLNTVMNSTFKELVGLAKAAPKLLAISKMGKPNQRVSDVLSEDQVRKVLNGK